MVLITFLPLIFEPSLFSLVLYSSRAEALKIADFGLTSEGTSRRALTTTSARGTSGYRAPELTRPQAKYTNKVDLFALGCVFYELFCKRKAFDSDWDIISYDLKSRREERQFSFHSAFVPDKFMQRIGVEIILPLLSLTPHARPSAEILLKISRRLKFIYLTHIVRLPWNRPSRLYPLLLNISQNIPEIPPKYSHHVSIQGPEKELHSVFLPLFNFLADVDNKFPFTKPVSRQIPLNDTYEFLIEKIYVFEMEPQHLLEDIVKVKSFTDYLRNAIHELHNAINLFANQIRFTRHELHETKLIFPDSYESSISSKLQGEWWKLSNMMAEPREQFRLFALMDFQLRVLAAKEHMISMLAEIDDAWA